MYAKIFLKIFDSSIAEDWQARIVFQDILILANRDGVVDMTHEAIARRTNVPLEIVKASIAKLEAPDPKSNTPEDDGRRLERIAEHKDWGWRVVNYERYRAIRNTDEMRAATRERVAAWRAKKKAELAPPVVNPSARVPEKSAKSPVTRPERPDLATVQAAAAEMELSELEAKKFFNYYEGNGWMTGKNPVKKWRNCLARWKLTSEERVSPSPGTNGKPLSIFEIKTVLEAKTKAAQDLKNAFAAEGPLTTEWTNPEAREKFKTLRNEIANLNRQLAARG